MIRSQRPFMNAPLKRDNSSYLSITMTATEAVLTAFPPPLRPRPPALAQRRAPNNLRSRLSQHPPSPGIPV